MAKKFAEITGIHKIFSADKIDDGTGNSEYKYNTFEIDTDNCPELVGNIDKNTIVFVTADDTDVDRIIGPNNYKISKDDCFIIAQNKVYATFGKVNVSDVMGPTGEDGITPEIGDNGNWVIGGVDTGVHAQGPQGNPGPVGSQYIQTDLNDVSFSEDALNIIQSNNISIGDYSISKDTNTIWKCISDAEFSQGPKIKGDPGESGASSSMPVGSVIMFAGNKVPNSNEWVFCKGQRIEVSNDGSFTCTANYVDFQELVNKIRGIYGETYIGGTDVLGKTLNDLNETTSNTYYIQIPDFSLRFPYGASDTLEISHSNDEIYGGTSTVEVPLLQHTHTYNVHSAGEEGDLTPSFIGSLNIDGSSYTTSHNTGPSGEPNASINIIPQYTMINFIIKYK